MGWALPITISRMHIEKDFFKKPYTYELLPFSSSTTVHTRAESRRFASRRRFHRRFFASGGRSGAGGGEELRDRRPMYITYYYSLGLVWLGLVSSVLVSLWRSQP
jgi:hypothetical protein